MGTSQDRDRIEYLPVTRERWPDMQKLFEASVDEELGNPSRCWCMEMRLGDRAQWQAQAADPGGEGNRKAMKALVQSGRRAFWRTRGRSPLGGAPCRRASSSWRCMRPIALRTPGTPACGRLPASTSPKHSVARG